MKGPLQVATIIAIFRRKKGQHPFQQIFSSNLLFAPCSLPTGAHCLSENVQVSNDRGLPTFPVVHTALPLVLFHRYSGDRFMSLQKDPPHLKTKKVGGSSNLQENRTNSV